MDRPTLRQVIERHRDRLLEIEGVQGLAAGRTDEDPPRPCIVVYAAERPAALPRELDGYPVELRRVSGFRAE